MKCSAMCQKYMVDMTDTGYKVWCRKLGLDITSIRNKFPLIYKDCPYYIETKGR